MNKTLIEIFFSLSLIATTFLEGGNLLSGGGRSSAVKYQDQIELLDFKLVKALKDGCTRDVESLLMQGADPNQVVSLMGGEFLTLLQYSLFRIGLGNDCCYALIARLLIEDPRTNLDEIAEGNAGVSKISPLFFASQTLDKEPMMELFELLLSRGACSYVKNICNATLDDFLESRYRPYPTILQRARAILAKARSKQVEAFLQASHPRLGVVSPAKNLPNELFYLIGRFV